jgi:hypothetical protein
MPVENIKQTAERLLRSLAQKSAARQEISPTEVWQIKGFFTQNFGRESNETARLERILAFNKGKRTYTGRAGDIPVQVKVVFDHLFVTRFYRGASLSYRFNQEGRLELIDSRELHSSNENAVHVLRILCKRLPKDWTEAEALLESMPDYLVYSINPNFQNLPRDDKFLEIVRYGHSEVRNLVTQKRHPPNFAPNIQNRQYPLPDLRNDLAAEIILKNAVNLKAYLLIDNFPYASVRY